jgi:ferredoxin
MRIFIHYFSATGNTARGVAIIRKELEKQRHHVSVHRIAEGPPEKTLVLRADHHLFAFPVLSWAPPSLMIRYVRGLPRLRGKKASAFCTGGGGIFQALQEMESLLRSSGFDVVRTATATYPENWTQVYSTPPAQVPAMIRQGDAESSAFGRGLGRNERLLHRTAFGHALWSGTVGFLFKLAGRRFLGKTYVADRNCNNCGLCVRTCPVGAITITGTFRKRPFWKSNCEDCNRCINTCPKKAIQTSLARFVLHLAGNIVLIVLAVKALLPLKAVLLPLAGPVGTELAAVLGILLIAVAVTAVQFTLLDRVLFLVQEIPGLRTVFDWGHTTGLSRYKAPGFNPAKE